MQFTLYFSNREISKSTLKFVSLSNYFEGSKFSSKLVPGDQRMLSLIFHRPLSCVKFITCYSAGTKGVRVLQPNKKLMNPYFTHLVGLFFVFVSPFVLFEGIMIYILKHWKLLELIWWKSICVTVDAHSKFRRQPIYSKLKEIINIEDLNNRG